ncbi:YqjK-like family protein, partial [Escherichia coli]|uniref:YqjK-like family protein n=1 Tax=Escherichia coli TaxID=562 RepID=UPI00237BDB7E
MNTRKTEENRKQKLLKQIEQQRQALGLLKADWLRITSPVDRGWQSLYQWRNVIVPAVGVSLFRILCKCLFSEVTVQAVTELDNK